jgi:hypothetical protein
MVVMQVTVAPVRLVEQVRLVAPAVQVVLLVLVVRRILVAWSHL